MWDKFCKDETEVVLKWWAIVLKSGDTLFARAEDEEAALLQVFGKLDCYAVKHAVVSVTPCRVAASDDFTFFRE